MDSSNQSHQSYSQIHQFTQGLASLLKRMRTPHFVITFATIFLLVYVVLIHFEANAGLILGMFTFSQVMVIGLAYVVVRHGVFDGQELDKEEEFGYEDFDHENQEFTRSFGKVMDQLKESRD